MAADQQAKPDANAEADGGVLGRLSQLAWQALPAIGSAIGFAGFVAVIGAAIEWIRFDAAGLPATQAVLAVPRQELVVLGAQALIGFVVGAVLAVLLVYLIDNKGNATPNTARGLVAVGVFEMALALFYIGHHPRVTYILLSLWLGLIWVVASYVVAAVMRDFTRRNKLKRARARVIATRATLAAADAAQAAAAHVAAEVVNDETKKALAEADGATLKAKDEFEQAIHEWTTAARALLIARGEDPNGQAPSAYSQVGAYATTPPNGIELEIGLDDAEAELGHVFRTVWNGLLRQLRAAMGEARSASDRLVEWFSRGKRKRTQSDDGPLTGPVGFGLAAFASLIAFVLLALIVVGIVLVATEHSLSWFAILLGAVAVLAMMNLFVARATNKFAWYGIAVFFSVLMFGAALTIARTLHRPSAQPIALVRKGDNVGVCGVYVTQTSDRIYVGRLVARGKRPGLMFWVPTGDVELVSVGQLKPIDASFSENATAMLAQLYKDRAEAPAAVLKNEAVTKIVGKEAAVGKKGSQETTTIEKPPAAVQHKRFPTEAIGAKCASQPVDP